MSASNPEPALAESARQPELTLSAVLLGIGLSVVMGAANVYLGLRAGMTVSTTVRCGTVAIGCRFFGFSTAHGKRRQRKQCQ